jgi:hypothetical protein
MRILWFSFALACAVVVPRAAQAYPQWQFSSGTSRCNQCHFAPAGTGLVTGYGRDAVGEDLSTWEGNGAFAHGAVELPGWLALGLDARGVILRHEAGDSFGPTQAIFPMQADAYARLSYDSVSFSITAGYRGSARLDRGPLGADAALPAGGSRIISREHYAMWRAGALGPYVRVGRFFAPYGLRLVEHTSYIRRDVGNNLLQEGYGVSVGLVQNEWELHITGLAPDFLRQFGSKELGAAALFEYRFVDAYALGLQARVGITEDGRRVGGGAYGKAYVTPIKTLLMAEANLFQVQGSKGGSSNQLVGYAGPTIFPYRGVWLGVYGEISQTDIRVKDTATKAVNGQLNWFPYPHFEFVVLGRLQAPEGNGSSKTLLLQLHYFL